ncbi:MAG: glycoside hydrolase family 32 protein, partial [Clostridiales bacterium]|nr:glycoside hydrolase family 32 protein [Clostridiales bacterium]
MTNMLENARAYETKGEAIRNRPVYHFSSPIGWLNDPNGFSCFNGEYHLFFQYHPYSVKWGPMHWGHCKTRDFVSWERLPAALAPDRKFDDLGCFSGTAIEYEGKHVIMYTGVSANGKLSRQEQCLAVGDGLNYEKLARNPVIGEDALPPGSNIADFRDPKIWRDGDFFYVAAASADLSGKAQIALFRHGPDLFSAEKWVYIGALAKSENMWECPDLFPIGGQHALIASLMDMKADGFTFPSKYGTVFFTGNFQKNTGIFSKDSANPIDWGLDFYAPQTLQASDGRRIMIAWIQSWDNCLTPEGAQWSGMMSFPRELELKGGLLIQKPARELDSRHVGTVLASLALDGNKAELPGVSGQCADMAVEAFGEFSISLAGNHARISFEDGCVKFERRTNEPNTAKVKAKSKDKVKLRILLDTCSVEVFVDDGEKT